MFGKGWKTKFTFVEKKNASRRKCGTRGWKGCRCCFFYLQNNLRVIVMFIKGMNSILERMNGGTNDERSMELKVKSYSMTYFAFYYINIFIS